MKTKTNYSVMYVLIAVFSLISFSCAEQSLEEEISSNELIMNYGGGDGDHGGGGAPN